MLPIRYQVVGEEDYAFVVEINESGEYFISSGTYTTERPRKGRLSVEQQQELLGAIKALGMPKAYPMPEGGEAFEARLTIGDETGAVSYPFWEGALATDAKLKGLVRLLETL
jgi:hypothetical protein